MLGFAARTAPALMLFLAACGGTTETMPADAESPVTLDGSPDRADDRQPTPRETGPEAATPDAGMLEDVQAPRAETGDAPAAPCGEGALELSWLGDYQRDVVARLAGDLEVEPGLKLTNRGTPNTRTAARRYLEGALRTLGLQPESHGYGTGTNVFARLDSTNGGAVHVVLGAHFDTVVRSPGANDNATGVALVLAAGRALAGLGCRSKVVLLVFFDEEEVGLVGAKQFSKKLVADQTAVHSVHTADQLGWDANGDLLMELERPDMGLRALYENAQRSLGLTFKLITTTTTGSDHTGFRPAFPAIGLTEGYASGDTSPHRHTPMDTASTVDFTYLRSATTLVARTMADLVR